MGHKLGLHALVVYAYKQDISKSLLRFFDKMNIYPTFCNPSKIPLHTKKTDNEFGLMIFLEGETTGLDKIFHILRTTPGNFNGLPVLLLVKSILKMGDFSRQISELGLSGVCNGDDFRMMKALVDRTCTRNYPPVFVEDLKRFCIEGLRTVIRTEYTDKVSFKGRIVLTKNNRVGEITSYMSIKSDFYDGCLFVGFQDIDDMEYLIKNKLTKIDRDSTIADLPSEFANLIFGQLRARYPMRKRRNGSGDDFKINLPVTFNRKEGTIQTTGSPHLLKFLLNFQFKIKGEEEPYIMKAFVAFSFFRQWAPEYFEVPKEDVQTQASGALELF